MASSGEVVIFQHGPVIYIQSLENSILCPMEKVFIKNICCVLKLFYQALTTYTKIYFLSKKLIFNQKHNMPFSKNKNVILEDSSFAVQFNNVI